jgi:hypothetical protein
MKFSFPVFRILILFAFIICTNRAYNQQLSDEVSSKLSESDQKKISKADNLTIKGDLQLSKASYPGDKQFLDMLSLGETKVLKKYAGERYVASDYYKDANSLKFLIFEGNCNEFWKKYTGEKKPLEIVKQAQLKAIKLFNDAQETRKVSSKKNKTAEKFSLLFEAETKEKEALTSLLKVLFVYLNYPVNYDQTWFVQSDTIKKSNNEPVNTNKKQTNSEVLVTTAKPITFDVPVINPTLESQIKPDTSIVPATSAKPITSEAPVIDLIKKSQVQPDTSINLNKTPTQFKKITAKEKETNNIPGDSSLYMIANVNEDQIDQFNNFLQKKYPSNYENYIIDFQKIDYSNLQSLKDAWYQYRFGTISPDSLALIAETTSHNDSTTKDTTKQVIAQNIKKPDSGTQTIAKKNSKTKNQKEKNQVIAELKETKTPATEISSEPVAIGFLFKVQIAACRAPINQNILKNIYQGSEKIIETNEDNWYKYTIGEFNTYRQARQLREATNVPGVFVVAYLNGKRIKITPAIVSKKHQDENIDGIQPDKIEFRVQLVVSKNSLDASVLKNIYNGPIAIDTIEEDGWLKYSLLAGNKLSDALELLKSINVPGAFVVSYYNRQKLNLHTAIKLTKKN